MFFNRNFSRNCWAFTVIMCIASVGYAVPFSQYGLIQGVQDYSNNPFYNPNNGTIITPQVVYNPGPVLNNTDCISLVNAVIQNVCAAQNNCKNKSLPDVRKDIMVTLSSSGFTGAASTCGGYIDYQFEQYKKQNTFATGASGTPFPTSFPTAQKKTTTKTDPTISKEQAAYNERAAELKALQAENGVGTDGIAKANFPTTFQDLSFTQRNAIKQAGYEKYKDAKVYVPLNIEYDPKYAKSKGNGGGGGGGGDVGTTNTSTFAADQKKYDNCIKKADKLNEQLTQFKDRFPNLPAVPTMTDQQKKCLCSAGLASEEAIRKKNQIDCTGIEVANVAVANNGDKPEIVNYTKTEVTLSEKNSARPWKYTLKYSVTTSDYGMLDIDSDYGVSWKCNTKYDRVEGDDELLYLSSWDDRDDNTRFYEVGALRNQSQCMNDHVVCVIGNSSSDEKDKHNACWTAKLGGNMEWCEDRDTSNSSGYPIGNYHCRPPYELPLCTDNETSSNKWTPYKKGGNKIAVFVDNQDRVIKINGYYPKTLVFWKTAEDLNPTCIGYICPDGTYGNADGSCSQSTQTTN